MNASKFVWVAIFLGGLTLGMSSCQSATSPTRTAEEKSLVTTTTEPTQMPRPSATPTVPPTATVTALPTATSTPTIPPEANLRIECLEVLPEIPSDFASEGILILDGMDAGNGLVGPETYLLNLETGEQTQITQSDENYIDQ
jgi:hypothetical protein